MILKEILKQPLENQKYSLSRDEYFREMTKAMKYFYPRKIINKIDIITPNKLPKKFLFKFN
jgi:hypothetical protein